MLEGCATLTAAAAADALRAGAEFTATESESLPGEHFAAIYRRRRRQLASTDADVHGLDDAIDRFERADEVAGLVTIMAADRHYSVFMAPRAAGTVVACLSTPAK
jgi:hypothetical protein